MLVAVAACGGTSEAGLTSAEAMEKFKELSPKEGAEYYVENHGQYSFLDTLYRDSVMPAVLQCNYFDLDSVRGALKGTPFVAEIEPVYNSKKEELKQQVDKELEENTGKQIDLYQKYYLPYLQMSIDSMIDEDVDKIMSKYAGGFLNFRKLAFLFGRNRNDFKEMFWDKFDTTRYQNQIKGFIESYFSSIKEQQSAYCKDLTGKDFGYTMKVVTPPFTIGLSQSTLSYVKKYTKQQSDEMFNEAVKDYAVPMLLGVVSGGVANLYDVGSTAYDINKMVKEIKEAKIDDDEMVKYICSHDLSYQIKNYYIDKWTTQVNDEIKKSNNELRNYILKNL